MTTSAATAAEVKPTVEASDVGEHFVPRGGVITAISIGLLLAAFLLYSLWSLWPATPPIGTTTKAPPEVAVTYLGFHFDVSKDVSLFLIVACAGALGGIVHSLRSLAWYVGNRHLKWSWMPFYALLPFVGGSLATVFYLVIRAGLFSPSSATQEVSPYGFAALAALVGLFSEQAMEKLRDVTAMLLSPAPKGEDHVGDAQNPPVAATGAATHVSAQAATLEGTVDPRNRVTTWFFEYGPTEQFGLRSRSDTATGEGPRRISVVIEQLSPHTTYHYRLVAESPAGRTEASDAVFTTAS
jgi:hypothetical protein